MGLVLIDLSWDDSGAGRPHPSGPDLPLTGPTPTPRTAKRTQKGTMLVPGELGGWDPH